MAHPILKRTIAYGYEFQTTESEIKEESRVGSNSRPHAGEGRV